MKTLRQLLFCTIAPILFFNGSCDKDDGQPSLPPITRVGANTFGCLINGRVLEPRDSRRIVIGSPQARGMIFWTSPTSLNYKEIEVNDYASERTGYIVLHIENLGSIGEYIINESNCQDGVDSPKTTNIHCRVYDPRAGFYKWYCSSENSGVITVTHIGEAVVSGTFQCTARNRDNPEEIIEITDGRFDINRASLSDTKFP